MASENHAPGYSPNPQYCQEDWDNVQSPEATDEQLAQARPLKEADPALYAALGEAQEAARHRQRIAYADPADPALTDASARPQNWLASCVPRVA